MPRTATYSDYVVIPRAVEILAELTPNLPPPSASVIRRAAKDGTLRAIKFNGRLLVHQDDIGNLIIQVDRRINERIRELVSAAPEFSDAQITQIRMLLGSGNGGAS